MDYFIINGHLSWLPETIFVHLFAASKEFIEARKRSLKRFLTLVVRHPVLCEDKIVNFFLTVKGSVSCPVEFYWNTPFQQSLGFVMVASICFCCSHYVYAIVYQTKTVSYHATPWALMLQLCYMRMHLLSANQKCTIFSMHIIKIVVCVVKDMCAISPRTLVRSWRISINQCQMNSWLVLLPPKQRW